MSQTRTNKGLDCKERLEGVHAQRQTHTGRRNSRRNFCIVTCGGVLLKKVHGPSLVSAHFTLPSNLVRKLQSRVTRYIQYYYYWAVGSTYRSKVSVHATYCALSYRARFSITKPLSKTANKHHKTPTTSSISVSYMSDTLYYCAHNHIQSQLFPSLPQLCSPISSSPNIGFDPSNAKQQMRHQ